MEATTMLLLFTLLLAGQRGCTCTASVVAGEGGFSVDFIHHDSAMSPFRLPALSQACPLRCMARKPAALQARVLGRSYSGASPVAAPVSAADGGVESKIITRSFEYLMGKCLLLVHLWLLDLKLQLLVHLRLLDLKCKLPTTCASSSSQAAT
ncbi:unnamed protein product [Miscanthus lutarioriparius]|uniref:Uncharacterized protein n=1 Tax=Miscanthus lutarioriparius TaxID=422564 RepID=A0A811Q9R8_9POAL|nr:unnamed protein product [Miscanthus lutarioriparius]